MPECVSNVKKPRRIEKPVRPKYRPYIISIVSVIIIDQLSKLYINAKFVPGETIQILGDILRFTFIYNPGGAFGISLGNSWFYSVVSMLAIVIVIVYFIKIPSTDKIAKYCLAFVVGGALGNQIDRIVYGKVIDFIDVNTIDIVIGSFNFLGMKFPGFQLYRWYVFNIADAAITLGLLGFIIYLLIQDKLGHQLIGKNNNKENSDGQSDLKTNSAGE